MDNFYFVVMAMEDTTRKSLAPQFPIGFWMDINVQLVMDYSIKQMNTESNTCTTALGQNSNCTVIYWKNS